MSNDTAVLTAIGSTTKSYSISVARHGGVFVAALFLVLGTSWAFITKPLDAPDEPAHLQVVMHVRNHLQLPEIHYTFDTPKGEFVNTPIDLAVLNYAKANGFSDEFLLSPYESMQPPLYYMAAGLAARLTPPDPQTTLYIARLISVLFGILAIYFSWAATRQLAPDKPWLAIIVSLTIALLPQFCANSSSVSNDSAANMAGAATLYVWFRGLRQPSYDPWMLRAGAVMGFCILAKLSLLVLLPGLALLILFRAIAQTRHDSSQNSSLLLKRLLPHVVRFGVFAALALLAIAGWWLLRNIIAYGELTGTQESFRHQTLNLPQWGDNTNFPDVFLPMTWQGLWGRFGWYDIMLPLGVYTQAIAISAICLTLTALTGVQSAREWMARKKRRDVQAWQAIIIMATALIGMTISFVQFNINVAFQPQARFFFPLILPLALAFNFGLYQLRQPDIVRRMLFVILVGWFVFINLSGLFIIGAIT